MKAKIIYTSWWCPNEPVGHFVCQNATQENIDYHLENCKGIKKPMKQISKTWEDEFEDSFISSNEKQEYHAYPYYVEPELHGEIKSFISQLLDNQREEIVREVEKLDYPKEHEDITHYRNGFDQAIDDTIKLIKEH